MKTLPPKSFTKRKPFMHRLKSPSVLPGFGISIGFTVFYLTIIVLIPLSCLFFKTSTISFSEFITEVTSPRVMHSYKVTFGAALVAALVNCLFGLIVAWILVRYKFPGKKLIDAIIDLPFALPTAIAGIALTALYSQNGAIGRHLEPLGIHIAFTFYGIVIAMIFVGLPFVVRTVQPVLQDMERETEEGAASLGASRWQVFYLVILPHIKPALLTGFALSFARALGEYGSIIFIAGNMPGMTEITPLLILIKLEQYDYTGATSIAIVMLLVSFIMLFIINILQRWNKGRLAQ